MSGMIKPPRNPRRRIRKHDAIPSALSKGAIVISNVNISHGLNDTSKRVMMSPDMARNKANAFRAMSGTEWIASTFGRQPPQQPYDSLRQGSGHTGRGVRQHKSL